MPIQEASKKLKKWNSEVKKVMKCKKCTLARASKSASAERRKKQVGGKKPIPKSPTRINPLCKKPINPERKMGKKTKSPTKLNPSCKKPINLERDLFGGDGDGNQSQQTRPRHFPRKVHNPFLSTPPQQASDRHQNKQVGGKLPYKISQPLPEVADPKAHAIGAPKLPPVTIPYVRAITSSSSPPPPTKPIQAWGPIRKTFAPIQARQYYSPVTKIVKTRPIPTGMAPVGQHRPIQSTQAIDWFRNSL